MVNKKCTIFTDRTPYHKTPLKYYFPNNIPAINPNITMIIFIPITISSLSFI